MSTVTLQSQDGLDFNVSLDKTMKSGTITNLVEDAGTEHPIPLPNINGTILQMVVGYICTDNIDLEVEQATMFDLILAANYLDIKGLLDITCKRVAGMIKGKTPEEIRKLFNIKCDFTEEEIEEVRKENSWCEDR